MCPHGSQGRLAVATQRGKWAINSLTCVNSNMVKHVKSFGSTRQEKSVWPPDDPFFTHSSHEYEHFHTYAFKQWNTDQLLLLWSYLWKLPWQLSHIKWRRLAIFSVIRAELLSHLAQMRNLSGSPVSVVFRSVWYSIFTLNQSHNKAQIISLTAPVSKPGS